MKMIAKIGVILAVVAIGDERFTMAQELEAPSDAIILFDGKGEAPLRGWKQSGNWTVKDAAISRSAKGGSLVYTDFKMPDDFELHFEWKVAARSNSGVYYRPGQYEYQILDNDGHPNGTNPRTTAASLYFCMPPSEDATRAVGKWNEAKIICVETRIQHWLNGKKVVDFDYTDTAYRAHVELLLARGGKLSDRGANLSLQDHGDPVWFRNIWLRKLKPDAKLDESKVTPMRVPVEVMAAERKKVDAMVRQRRQAAAEESKPSGR